MTLYTVHVISSPSPLNLGSQRVLLADCGKEIENPELVAMWDSQAMGAFIEFAPNVCHKCQLASEWKLERYVYGIHRGEPAA